jgi:hypothetical protein
MDTAADHVAKFIATMNSWELATLQAQREAKESHDLWAYLDGAAAALYLVLREFCVPEVTEIQGQATFGRPPLWDPAKETIVESSEGDQRASVETMRRRTLGGGRFRYGLRRTPEGWRIANLEKLDDGVWVPRSLPSTDLHRVPPSHRSP